MQWCRWKKNLLFPARISHPWIKPSHVNLRRRKGGSWHQVRYLNTFWATTMTSQKVEMWKWRNRKVMKKLKLRDCYRKSVHPLTVGPRSIPGFKWCTAPVHPVPMVKMVMIMTMTMMMVKRIRHIDITTTNNRVVNTVIFSSKKFITQPSSSVVSRVIISGNLSVLSSKTGINSCTS